MDAAVPVAALLAVLGAYGAIAAGLALIGGGKRLQRGGLDERSEWVGVLCVSTLGLLGGAAGVAALFGSASWVAYAIAIPVVGLLGWGFFRMLEISPAPVLRVMVDTRHLGRRWRRSRVNRLRLWWAESDLGTDLRQTQAEVQVDERRRAATRGAVSMSSFIVLANAAWVARALDGVEGAFIYAVGGAAVAWVGLVIALRAAGQSLAERGSEIDWRRPF